MLTKGLKIDVGAEPCQGLLENLEYSSPVFPFLLIYSLTEMSSAVSCTKMMALFSQNLSAPLVGVQRSLLFISETPSCPEQK